MTLISHNLHTQVIMAWLRKNFIFQKRRRSLDKRRRSVGNTIPALMCLSDVCQIHCGDSEYSIPTYSSIQTYNPQVHMPCWVTLKWSQSCCPVAWYNTQTLDGTSDKIWCIYLKIIKFYLISIFFELTFMMNSMRHWNCGLRTHIQQSWISRFNFSLGTFI